MGRRGLSHGCGRGKERHLPESTRWRPGSRAAATELAEAALGLWVILWTFLLLGTQDCLHLYHRDNPVAGRTSLQSVLLLPVGAGLL